MLRRTPTICRACCVIIRRQYSSKSAPAARCYISKSTDAFTNLAFEDWLFRKTDPTTYILFLWRDRDCVVIGRNQNPWKEVNMRMLKRLDIPLVRRKSGGGTVFHDIGNTNYSIMMPRNEFQRDKNAELVARALHHLDIPARVNERHDIVVDNYKIAYKLVNARAYHHGTMLIDTNMQNLHDTLHVDSSSISTKGVESVRSKVRNLRDFSLTIGHLSFCEAMQDEFGKEYYGKTNVPVEVIDDNVVDDIEYVKDVRNELQSWDWQFGQTPAFTQSLKGSNVSAYIEARHGRIEKVDFDPIMEDLSDSLSNVKYDPDIVATADVPLSRTSIRDWLASQM